MDKTGKVFIMSTTWKTETDPKVLKKYKESKYIRVLANFEKDFHNRNARLGQCLLCTKIMQLGGIGGHLHYKHGVKR